MIKIVFRNHLLHIWAEYTNSFSRHKMKIIKETNSVIDYITHGYP